MAQGKCSLLKPVDSLTGTFFMFSQYTQDLTKQYSNPDSYRCVPSKFIAMNLDYTPISSETTLSTSESAAILGEIFQNYFENSCTFLRGKYFDSENQTDSWNPEYTRTLLFQTLEKYQLLVKDESIEDESATSNGSESTTYGDVSGISRNIQYIGDINIYSYDDTVGGVGYNEIYCYIPNEAKCTDYQLCAVSHQNAFSYPFNYICGYENQQSYNNLSWLVDEGSLSKPSYIDIDEVGNCYAVGRYGSPGNYENALVPLCLLEDSSNDQPRKMNTGTEQEPVYVDVDKFDVNTIVVLYDIVRKDELNGQYTIYKNIPLGIYFTGCLDEQKSMSNKVVKFVNSGQVYNQGTSYGLRVCTRFLSTPNSTEPIEVEASGSSNVSMMAPVLEKMSETLMSVESILDDKDAMYQMIKDHLAQFKNNKVNVPYVRQLGTKKYWFVNGKNTGAIAQYEYADPEDIVSRAIQEIIENVYTKEQIASIVQNYVTRNEFNNVVQNYSTINYVDHQIAALERKLLVYLQGIEETE